jgi:hypothetical protein
MLDANKIGIHTRTRSDNKIRELATVCLSWQQWTETAVWFDAVGITVFHSCVVVDLWQSLSEWHLLLSECILVCCRRSGSEIREILMQDYGYNAMKKTAVYKRVTCFSKGRESVTDEERSGQPAASRTEENITKVCQIVPENHQLAVRSIAEQANINEKQLGKS